MILAILRALPWLLAALLALLSPTEPTRLHVVTLAIVAFAVDLLASYRVHLGEERAYLVAVRHALEVARERANRHHDPDTALALLDTAQAIGDLVKTDKPRKDTP